MKILIAINQSRVLYDFKRELVDALAARGAEVILTLEEDFRAEYFKKKNYRILPAPIDPRGMNPVSDAKLSRFYRELLTKERPDAALTFTIKPNVYCGRLCAKLGIPYYATISGLGSALNGSRPLRGVVFVSSRAEGSGTRFLSERGDRDVGGESGSRDEGAD